MDLLPTLEYEFAAPRRIVFGWGKRTEVGRLGRELGRSAYIINGSRTLQQSGAIDQVRELLQTAGVESSLLYTISREPLVEDVDHVTTQLRDQIATSRKSEKLGDSFILAIGGGAAIDLGKAVAALVSEKKNASVRDYLEGVGQGLTLSTTPWPVLAMPSTAGTGSEVTKNAVISNLDPPFKKSLRHACMIPAIVLADPELTVSVPPSITAQSGMDAITQLIESFISLRASPIPQALCIQGLRIAAPAILEAVEDGTSRLAREAMSHAALLSGLALANSGLGMAHGVAAALGVHVGVAHGLACAVMLPVALRTNRSSCQRQFARLARAITGTPSEDDSEAADALMVCIEDLCSRIGIPSRLGELGVTAEQIPAIVESSRGNSMSGNPREMTDEELSKILTNIL